MIFTSDEIRDIRIALETYDKLPRGDLIESVQRNVVAAALQKLNSFNLFTSFSKQEFTVMALSVHFLIYDFARSHKQVSEKLFALREKLMDLAEPE